MITSGGPSLLDEKGKRDITEESHIIYIGLLAKRLKTFSRATFAEHLLSARCHKLTPGLQQ